MKISYAVTVFNEIKEIKNLFPFLSVCKREEDEIVILMDDKGPNEIWDYLLSINPKLVIINRLKFNNNFSEWKNKLKSLCSGDYLFNIDADEVPSTILIKYLPEILESNPDIKAFALPRVNTVHGLTQQHINEWGWEVNEKKWINYPDLQIRIFKNHPEIYWEKRVHERLNIWREAVPLPIDTDDWVLYHHKDIKRQEKQNLLYSTL